MNRHLDAWVAAALACIAAAVGACLLAHGVLPGYALLWWTPLVPAVLAIAALAVVFVGVRKQRRAANQQRLVAAYMRNAGLTAMTSRT